MGETTALRPPEVREPIDMIHDGIRVVTSAHFDLRNIAGCLNRVGMSTLADEIFEIAADLDKASKDIRAGYSLDLNQQLRRSGEATANVLHAVLAGIKVSEVREPE